MPVYPSLGLGGGPAEVRDQAGTLTGTPLEPLAKLVRDVTRQPLLAGNRVTPLADGDQAYPAMLQAIDEAARSVTLVSQLQTVFADNCVFCTGGLLHGHPGGGESD